jgi:hypothetical protein
MALLDHVVPAAAMPGANISIYRQELMGPGSEEMRLLILERELLARAGAERREYPAYVQPPPPPDLNKTQVGGLHVPLTEPLRPRPRARLGPGGPAAEGGGHVLLASGFWACFSRCFGVRRSMKSFNFGFRVAISGPINEPKARPEHVL